MQPPPKQGPKIHTEKHARFCGRCVQCTTHGVIHHKMCCRVWFNMNRFGRFDDFGTFPICHMTHDSMLLYMIEDCFFEFEFCLMKLENFYSESYVSIYYLFEV